MIEEIVREHLKTILDVPVLMEEENLARGFAEMLEGAPSPLGLEHGLASAAACLAARRAAQTHREETIEYGF